MYVIIIYLFIYLFYCLDATLCSDIPKHTQGQNVSRDFPFSFFHFFKVFSSPRSSPFETTQEILVFVSFGLIHQGSSGVEFAICSDVLESKMLFSL